jgi:hypothetical protein
VNKLLSDVRNKKETNHCVLGGLVLNFTQKSSHTSRYYYVLGRESKHVSLAVKFLSRFYRSGLLKNKNTSIRSSQGYSDVAAPGAGGSDPAVPEILTENILPVLDAVSHTNLNMCVSFPEKQVVNKPILCLKDRMDFYYLKYGSAAAEEAA